MISVGHDSGRVNSGRPYELNGQLQVTVPNGQVLTAVGGTNWEGVRVVPDVEARTSRALNVGTARALRELMESATDSAWREQLRRRLSSLERPGEEN